MEKVVEKDLQDLMETVFQIWNECLKHSCEDQEVALKLFHVIVWSYGILKD